MISWIVATHDPRVLATNLLASIGFAEAVAGPDELVVVEDAPSIAVAYNQGQAQATRPIRCYIHHDVQILDLEALRAGLLERCPTAGIVGVIGSRNPVVPWWEGDRLGSVVDGRFGILDYRPGGPSGPCAYLDGLLLATSHSLEWDESYPGWHLYDHDICRQQLDRGFTNWCLDNGAELVRHNTSGTSRMVELTGWDVGLARFTGKYQH